MRMTWEIRRKYIQFLTILLTNPEAANLCSGRIYKGGGKAFCAPGLNCYSCPAAALSCPVGALQAVGGQAGFSFYVSGFLLLIGVLWGRLACGFLCPFGLMQELLHKLPCPRKKLYLPLRWVKYGILAVFVLLWPAASLLYGGAGVPAFCQYICPAGTLEGAVPLLLAHPEFRQAAGGLFAWKALLLVLIIAGSMSIYRLFCRMLCPLGAIYGLLNRVCLYRLQVDKGRCTDCGKCAKACPMDVHPAHQPHSPECIMCGKCMAVCPQQALYWGKERDLSIAKVD